MQNTRSLKKELWYAKRRKSNGDEMQKVQKDAMWVQKKEEASADMQR